MVIGDERKSSIPVYVNCAASLLCLPAAQIHKMAEHDAREKIKRYFAGGQDSISILIAGKMSTGKSTLVNGIVGKLVAKEGNKAFTETTIIVPYETTVEIPGTILRKQIKVVVWDTPGLGDPFGDDEATAKEIAEKCKETDLLVYCLDIRGRLAKDDATGIDLLSTTLQAQMWKNAIFALTFANEVPDQATLTEKIQSWEEAIKRLMKKKLKIPNDIADDISIVPTGYRRHQPPGCEDWFSPFWAASFIKTKRKAQPSLLGINAGRLLGESEDQEGATPAEEAYQMPIRFSSSDILTMRTATTTTGSAGVGALIGLIAGAVGGPITMPVGAAVGAAAGGGIGFVTRVIVKSVYDW